MSKGVKATRDTGVAQSPHVAAIRAPSRIPLSGGRIGRAKVAPLAAEKPACEFGHLSQMPSNF
jgi:hypothetical protein